MRVIAGSAKGRRLHAPKGLATRPTSDLIRGAIFSMIHPVLTAELRVLDLYAGTGALGIEALSRGAAWADFVERDAGCARTLRQNLERAGFQDRSQVYCCAVSTALGFLGEPYGVIFLDPPYAARELEDVVARVGKGDLVAAGGLLVVEHARRRPLAESYPGLVLLKERCHGDTCVAIYQREPLP